MAQQLETALAIASHQVTSWMPFNLLLAAIPLMYAAGLFARRRLMTAAMAITLLLAVGLLRTADRLQDERVYVLLALLGLALLAPWLRPRGGTAPLWWIAFAAFLLFLPNAAYVLTDGLHYTRAVRETGGGAAAAAVLTAQYAIYTSLGFFAYALSIRWLLARMGVSAPARRALAVLGVSFVVAVGLYIGRIEQLHSWHPFTEWELSRAVFERQVVRLEVWGFIAAAAAALALLSGGALLWLDRMSRLRCSRAFAASAFAAAGVFALIGAAAPVAVTGVTVDAAALAMVALGTVLLVAAAWMARIWSGPRTAWFVAAAVGFAAAVLGSYVGVDHAQRTIVPGRQAVQDQEGGFARKSRIATPRTVSTP